MKNNMTDDTISQSGLKLSNQKINAQIAPEARVFEFIKLKKVFIMESDLYGNAMPEDSCFLAFYGKNGLMGKHLKIETLKRSNIEDIKKMVTSNNEG